MQIKTLYRYADERGRTVVLPNRPDGSAYTVACRLIAEEGMAMTKDGIHFFGCIDDDSPEGWTEVENPTDNEDSVSDAELMEQILNGEVSA